MDSGIIFKRKHNDVCDNETVWEESLRAYKGGNAHIKEALVKHVSELDAEFEERIKRAHYFNYPRAIAQRITSFALAVEPKRFNAEQEIISDFNRSGLRANDVMRQVSTFLSVFGRLWVYVAMPHFEGTVTLDRVNKERLWPYAKVLSPLDVKDYAYAADGRLAWAIIEEKHVYDNDPFTDNVKATRRRLWTRAMWQLYERGINGDTLIEEGMNATGVIPLVEVSEPDGFALNANHWFEDVVRISNSIMNNESESQMNVVKQLFGLLVVSDSFSRGAKKAELKETDKNKDSFAMIVSRSFAAIESPEERGITRYVSPQGAETEAIRKENDALKIELYEVVGLAMQSRSREAQSRDYKSWDFQNVAQFLANRADILENAERKIWEEMNRLDPTVSIPEITYNRKFAVRDLEKSIQGLLQLSTLPDAGIEFKRQTLRAGKELLNDISEIDEQTDNAINKEIDTTEPAPVPEFSFNATGNVDNHNINNNSTGDDNK